MSPRAPRRPFFHSTGLFIREAFRTIRAGGWRLVALYAGSQLAIILIAFPVIRWLFAEALRASGMVGLDLGALSIGPGLPVTLLLIVVITLLAFWLISLQLALLIIALGRIRAGESLHLRVVAADLGHIAKKLVRPSSAPLVGLLFFLMPLANFGFISVLTRAISVPAFITGELEKTATGTIALIVFFAVIAFLNLRFALALPIFALSDATGGRAMRASWRLTRGFLTRGAVLAAGALAILFGSFGIGLVSAFALIPTAVSDLVTPDASVPVAAFSLGVSQVIAVVLAGITVAALAAVLVSALATWADELPATITLRDLGGGLDTQTVAHRTGFNRKSALILTGLAAVIVLVLGFANLRLVQELSSHPDTLVLAHRGFSQEGAENTIGGLEAANQAGADIVEMDVMETKDGKFVVMHDANLSRLAGRDETVADLTFDELTAITVTDQFGHQGLIPSLEDYLKRANELDQTLLIEVKLHGGEAPDLVPRLVAEIEDLGFLEDHIYHGLDKPTIEGLKAYRPNLTVGYTMAFAGSDAPSTIADFIVVEGWSSTPALQRAALNKGLAYLVWTVNDPEEQRQLLRDNVDGIITDRPDLALESRSEMDQDQGVAGVLSDALARLVRLG